MPKKTQKNNKENTYPKRKVKLIFDAVAGGSSLRKACAEQGMAPSTALLWCSKFPEVDEQYARACEARTKGKLERLQELYEKAHEAADAENGNLALQAIKIELDSTRWEMSKLLPAFGDRQSVRVEHSTKNKQVPGETWEETEKREFAEIVAQIVSEVENEKYEQGEDSH